METFQLLYRGRLLLVRAFPEVELSVEFTRAMQLASARFADRIVASARFAGVVDFKQSKPCHAPNVRGLFRIRNLHVRCDHDGRLEQWTVMSLMHCRLGDLAMVQECET